MSNFGLGTCASACGCPYGTDAMSLAAVQKGEKRGGHPSTVASVLQPQRELRLGQAVTFPSSEGYPLHTVPPTDPIGNMALGGPLVTGVSAPTPCLSSSVQCPKSPGRGSHLI